MTALPLELWNLVCTHVPRDDLGTVRLVSRRFSKAAQPALFRVFNLTISVDSFESLQNITAHTELRKLVKIINFDPTRLDGGSAAQGYTAWRSEVAATGAGYFNFRSKSREDYLAELGNKQVEKYYFRYCFWLFGYQNLLKNELWLNLLKEALDELPGLSELRYNSFRYDLLPSADLGEEHLPLSTQRYMTRQILAEPTDKVRGHESNKILWALVQAARRAKDPGQIKSIIGTELYLGRWQENSETYGGTFQGLPSLQHLRLHFGHQAYLNIPDVVKTAVTSLSKMIAEVTSLKSLDLEFLHRHYDTKQRIPVGRGFQRQYKVTMSIQNHVFIALHQTLTGRWDYLIDLVLSGIKASQGDLEKVMTERMPKLRQLKLIRSVLIHSVNPPEPLESPEYNRKSALNIIQAIATTSPSLEYLVFDRVSTSKEDAWHIEAVQRRYVDKYDHQAFCGCVKAPRGVNSRESGVQDGDKSAWIFGDLSGWFDGDMRELCACEKDQNVEVTAYGWYSL